MAKADADLRIRRAAFRDFLNDLYEQIDFQEAVIADDVVMREIAIYLKGKLLNCGVATLISE